MTSYSSMAACGREAARETNTRFRLRKIVEVREVQRSLAVFYPDLKTSWTEFVGECGHVVDEKHGPPRPYDTERITRGKRKRCHQCPIEGRNGN